MATSVGKSADAARRSARATDGRDAAPSYANLELDRVPRLAERVSRRRGMNLRDVAKKARVGSATVSRVLNDHPDVKSSTRARVLRAIEDLKYRPNLHARTLAGGKTHVLGVVMVNLYNPFFTDICVAMETNAVLRGYEIALSNADRKSTRLNSSH